jgi:hypothetical protein
MYILSQVASFYIIFSQTLATYWIHVSYVLTDSLVTNTTTAISEFGLCLEFLSNKSLFCQGYPDAY